MKTLASGLLLFFLTCFAGSAGLISHTHPVFNAMNQEKSSKAPSLSIQLALPQLKRGAPAVVKLRIENTTKSELKLSEPSSFFLQTPEDNELKKISESYTASTRLWEYLPHALKANDDWVLNPGEFVECEIDLTMLNWRLSKSPVYVGSPAYPSGNLFHEVPGGCYTLFFGLHGPQKLIEGLPRVDLFRSNEISVSLNN